MKKYIISVLLILVWGSVSSLFFKTIVMMLLLALWQKSLRQRFVKVEKYNITKLLWLVLVICLCIGMPSYKENGNGVVKLAYTNKSVDSRFPSIKQYTLSTLLQESKFTSSDNNQWKEGDIVFQISQSAQSKYVQLTTGSPWSHCGIVVEKNKKLYVLEASNVVKLTSLRKWINRGKYKVVRTRRVFNDPIKIKYSQYLGQPYDLAFKFDNNKMYCSELVYEIYKNQFDIKLGKPKKVKHFRILGLSKILKRRGISPDQLVIAPCDLL